MPETVALIVAAGRGDRAGTDVPKQYVEIAGRPLLAWTVAAFAASPRIDAIRIAIDPAWRNDYDKSVAGLNVGDPITGGASRQASVAAGLEALASDPPAKVLVHDAARPFVSKTMIDGVIDALDEADGAVPGIPVSDTLKFCDDKRIEKTVSRDGLWHAQTPQGFRFEAILQAHRQAVGRALTDDAAVAEAAGLDVRIVEGAASNVKITTAEDVIRAGELLGRREQRSGFGFDAHAFTDGDHVTLCGVDIAHDQGLAGNTDADVGLHVLVDAIFGALGVGDLGTHFPPSDTTWHGRPSSDLVAVAFNMMRQRDARLVNADLTLVCERPRLAAHLPAMSERIAELLETTPDRINVKVTSTDGMGMTGRGEGIAATAVVNLDLPVAQP